MQYFLDFFARLFTLNDDRKKLALILKLLLFDLLFTTTFFLVFNGGVDVVGSLNDINLNFKTNVVPILFSLSVWIFFEELFHRFPISFFINKKISLKFKLVLIIILSLIFSLLHLPSFGFWEVIVIVPPIFVGGIIYSFIYILAGASKGKIMVPFIVVYFIHLFWDLIAFTLTSI